MLIVLSKYFQNANTIKLYIGPFRTGLVTIDYKFVEFLLSHNKEINKSENYYFLYPWLGNGLLLSAGKYISNSAPKTRVIIG